MSNNICKELIKKLSNLIFSSKNNNLHQSLSKKENLKKSNLNSSTHINPLNAIDQNTDYDDENQNLSHKNSIMHQKNNSNTEKLISDIKSLIK